MSISPQEKVEPGKVNKMISFFENQGDDTPPRDKQEFNQTSHCHADVVKDYFSSPKVQNGHSSSQITVQSSTHTEWQSSSTTVVNGTSLEDRQKKAEIVEDICDVEETTERFSDDDDEEPVQLQRRSLDKYSSDEEKFTTHQKEEHREQFTTHRQERSEQNESESDEETETTFEDHQYPNCQTEDLEVIQETHSEPKISHVEVEHDQQLQKEECHIDYEKLPKHLKGYGNPTVHPCPYFDVEYDVAALKKAMKGLGTNEKAIIEILTQRSSEQRQEIIYKYQQSYGKDLLKELCKELSGSFEDIVLALMTSYFAFLATELRKAIKGAGTDERTLTEIICTCDDISLGYIKEAYQHLYKRSLKDDVYEDTSGDLRKIYISVLAACREDPKSCSPEAVAVQLSATNEKGKPDLDGDVVRTVLVTYTRPFLYFVFEAYELKTGKAFGELIETVCKGDARDALLALYKSIVCLPIYYAEELKLAMKGPGTKNSTLIRIIVSRSEIDLDDIKEEFNKLYPKDLHSEVKNETSGDYRTTLLALIEGSNQSKDFVQVTSQESLL